VRNQFGEIKGIGLHFLCLWQPTSHENKLTILFKMSVTLVSNITFSYFGTKCKNFYLFIYLFVCLF